MKQLDVWERVTGAQSARSHSTAAVKALGPAGRQHSYASSIWCAQWLSRNVHATSPICSWREVIIRPWSKFPGRFKDEANSVSGVAALAGAGAVALGATVAAPIVLILGGVVTGAAVLWCGVKAVPPRARRPEEIVGESLDLRVIREIHPRLRRIAFIGPTQGGKSTCISHLRGRVPAGDRTDSPYATVVVIQSAPPAYFALIDGAGQQFSQQFLLSDEADDVIVCLDHNEGDSSSEIDIKRLSQHELFLEQMFSHMRHIAKEPDRLFFLLNKRDLWEKNHDASELSSWFVRQVEEWRKRSRGSVSYSTHSNRVAEDMTKLTDLLRKWAEKE